MRWPRISWRRTPDTERRRPSSTSSSDIPHDEPKANQVHDPSFARLFSDADLFGNILNSRTDHPEAGLTVEAQSVGDSLPVNGFSRLVAQDLDEHERAISEKFAQISVSNWSSAGAHPFPLGVDPGESDESTSEDEAHRTSPTGPIKEAGEPDFEAKLDPIEIIDLLDQEFGALAPKGEEKLLLESDASIFQDVAILVRYLFISRHSALILTTDPGRGASYHTPPYLSRISSVLSIQRSAKCHKVWLRSRAPQRVVPEEESLAAVRPRYDQHIPFKSR